MSESENSKTCQLCGSASGKYVCPRCNLMYCSVSCYRSEAHSQCSEQFYRHCVEEELLADQPEGQEPQTMMQILQRMHQQDETAGQAEGWEEEEEADSDDSSGAADEDLAQRLAGVNLDDADAVWEKLSKEEKEGFQQILASGDPTSLLPIWEPWWNLKVTKPLVVELDGDQAEEDVSFKKQCPAIREDIPALKDPSHVSPAVQHGVENALLSYCLMARHFAGEHQGAELRGEASQALLQLSGSLGRGDNFLDRDTAVAAVTLEASQYLGATQESILQGQEDLLRVLEGPCEQHRHFYLQAALSDSIKLLSDSLSTATPTEKPQGSFSQRFGAVLPATKWSKKQITLALRKLEFYLAWSKSPAALPG